MGNLNKAENPYDPYMGEPAYLFPPIRKDLEFFGRLLGKKVRVILNNDDDLYGELIKYNRYEIVLKLDDDPELCDCDECSKTTTVLLMKHAIVCIIPDDETVFDKKKPEEIPHVPITKEPA